MSTTFDARAREPSRPSPSWITIAAFVGATMVLGALIGATNAPDAWYRALAKPAWNPPDWVFAPVWTALYAMVGYAGARAWSLAGGRWRDPLVTTWFAQMALNFAWTPIFFTGQALGAASLEIVALLAVVASFVLLAGGRDRVSAWLFVPYLAWVGFAAALTWTIWSLN